MMARARSLTAALALALLLSGCVAAVIPLAAAGAIARKKAKSAKRSPEPVSETTAAAKPATAAPQAPKPDNPSQETQIDGAYGPFIRFALTQTTLRQTGYAVNSVALASPVVLEKPAFMACGDMPPAIIIDLDVSEVGSGEDAALGFPKAVDLDIKGLAAGLERLRGAGISVIWMSERSVEEQDGLLEALKASGLVSGDGDTLYLSGSGDYRKQTRRIEAASKSCIIAMAGDRKADFDELFDYLREPEAAFRLDSLIDAGWFLTPAPLPPAIRVAKSNEETNALDPR